MLLTSFQRAMRSKIALMLAIWLGGLGCLLCCGIGETEASVNSCSVAANQDNSHISSGSSCCKKTNSSSSCKKAKSSTDHCNTAKKKQPDKVIDSRFILAASTGMPVTPTCTMCCPINS